MGVGSARLGCALDRASGASSGLACLGVFSEHRKTVQGAAESQEVVRACAGDVHSDRYPYSIYSIIPNASGTQATTMLSPLQLPRIDMPDHRL